MMYGLSVPYKLYKVNLKMLKIGVGVVKRTAGMMTQLSLDSYAKRNADQRCFLIRPINFDSKTTIKKELLNSSPL